MTDGKPLERQNAPQATRGDSKARAARLTARLESQIAATADQRAVLTKVFEHPIVVEPHRDHHAYQLGADLHRCGLATGDVTAMLGLMSIGPARLADLLIAAARTHPNIYVARLWPILIDAGRDEYEARGRFVSWQRRWARYKEDADAWAARGSEMESSWRALHMTSGQRHLVRDCAVLLGLDLPDGMDRGRAHDWLMVHGANTVYRREA